MTRHQHPRVQRVVRRLRPSPESVAGAVAVHDPGSLLRLNAARRSGGRVTSRGAR